MISTYSDSVLHADARQSLFDHTENADLVGGGEGHIFRGLEDKRQGGEDK